MDENKDFVIDTGMPVVPPVSEEQTADSSVVNPVPQDDSSPAVEETMAEEAPLETPEPNEAASQEPEEIISSPDENGPSLADVYALIETLQKEFKEKIAVDDHKNMLFDKLYKERDEYKNDLYGKLLKPFVTGCLEIVTDLRMYISKIDTFDVERSLNYLKSLPDDLIELLENNGVELYSEEGDSFNPRVQRAKKIVPTEDPALNNTIAERLERGYRWNGSVLRPEMVSVYRVK